VWLELGPGLHAQGLLTTWDAAAFSVYSSAVAVDRQATEAIAAEGAVGRGYRAGR
jgi:phage terminase small subunit